MEIVCYACGKGENPENTIDGIKHCLSVNPEWRIEMDLQFTKDEEVILFHDNNTSRITGKHYQINALKLDEVRQLNAGYNYKIHNEYLYRAKHIQIPKLEEVLKEFNNMKMLLDIHSDNPKIIDKIISLIEENSIMENTVIVSHYDKILKGFRHKRPDWIFGTPANEAKKLIFSSFFYLDELFPLKSNILMIPQKYGKINVLTKRIIKHVHKRNKEVWAWLYEGKDVKTVNSLKDLTILKQIGVDSFFTEFPKKLFNELKKKTHRIR